MSEARARQVYRYRQVVDGRSARYLREGLVPWGCASSTSFNVDRPETPCVCSKAYGWIRVPPFLMTDIHHILNTYWTHVDLDIQAVPTSVDAKTSAAEAPVEATYRFWLSGDARTTGVAPGTKTTMFTAVVVRATEVDDGYGRLVRRRDTVHVRTIQDRHPLSGTFRYQSNCQPNERRVLYELLVGGAARWRPRPEDESAPYAAPPLTGVSSGANDVTGWMECTPPGSVESGDPHTEWR